MKKLISTLAIVLLMIFGLISCNQKEPTRITSSMESFELSPTNDTFNIELNGQRQGHWIIRKAFILKQTLSSKNLSDTTTKYITSRLKVEEGFYKDNKKEGYWKQFYPTGKLKDSVNYKNGVAVN